MTPAARKYLEVLRSDDERCRLVEDLRCAASTLDGTHWKVPAHILTRVSLELAARLRVVAAQLCDHARLHPISDGAVCRYCERWFPGGTEP
jgi:hypothetical protein